MKIITFWRRPCITLVEIREKLSKIFYNIYGRRTKSDYDISMVPIYSSRQVGRVKKICFFFYFHPITLHTIHYWFCYNFPPRHNIAPRHQRFERLHFERLLFVRVLDRSIDHSEIARNIELQVIDFHQILWVICANYFLGLIYTLYVGPLICHSLLLRKIDMIDILYYLLIYFLIFIYFSLLIISYNERKMFDIKIFQKFQKKVPLSKPVTRSWHGVTSARL